MIRRITTEDEKPPYGGEHHAILTAYADRKISRKQAEAQLRDIGMTERWELELYLDNDQTGPE